MCRVCWGMCRVCWSMYGVCMGYVGVCMGHAWDMLGYVWGLLKNHGVTRAGVEGGGRFFFLISKLVFMFYVFFSYK